MTAADQPIPGLYAVGADAASVMAGHYPSGGIALGPAMTFGYIAGLHAVGVGERDQTRWDRKRRITEREIGVSNVSGSFSHNNSTMPDQPHGASRHSTVFVLQTDTVN